MVPIASRRLSAPLAFAVELPGRRSAAKLLTKDEARWFAVLREVAGAVTQGVGVNKDNACQLREAAVAVADVG